MNDLLQRLVEAKTAQVRAWARYEAAQEAARRADAAADAADKAARAAEAELDKAVREEAEKRAASGSGG